MAQIKTKIVLRNDTMANWLAYGSRIVLLKGEVAIAFDLDGSLKIKIGDGVSTWNELPFWGGNLSVSVDGKSLMFNNNGHLSVHGFDNALVGTSPVVQPDGSIGWEFINNNGAVDFTERIEALEENVQQTTQNINNILQIVQPEGEISLTQRITEIENILNGDSENSLDQKIEAKLAFFETKQTDDHAVNTLAEVYQYIADHEIKTADIENDLSNLQTLLGDQSVQDQIAEALKNFNADGVLTPESLESLYVPVKYEMIGVPPETLVDYTDYEIRIMVPSDCDWSTHDTPAELDPSSRYIGLKAYAPKGASHFKHDLAEIIADDTLYDFSGSNAGTDGYGRKYTVVWLPVARYNDEAAAWIYHGAESNASKFAGWHYSVEWYSQDGSVINTDAVRVNLSNESCHHNAEPYFMQNVVKEIYLNGVKTDVVNHRVDLEMTGTVMSGDEITVNEDGTLSIKQIDVTKLVSSDDHTIVLNGGSASV